EMANHKSALKRIKQTEKRRLHNRYYAKTMRNAVRKLRSTTDKAAATAMFPKVTKIVDKLAKVNIIHKNKADNLKSKLAIYINKLA
ncbi:30S ribosomal protein S20, partial [termite gut metagenome]